MSKKPRLLFILWITLTVLDGTGFVFAVRSDRNLPQDDLESQASKDRVGRDTRSNTNSPGARDSDPMSDSHSALTDCVRCHGNRPDRTSPEEAKLVAPVPRLCSSCHEQYASLDGWVHGPAATGDCLFCHDPHQSEWNSLLTKPIPELCYECHTRETLGLIGRHSEESYRRCDACHESHAGLNRTLLKPSFLDSDAGAQYREEPIHHRSRYTFVDRRSSLAGLQDIRVIVVIERQDVLARYGLLPEIVKAEVEQGLRKRGIRIQSDQEQAAGRPGLHIGLRLVELRLPAYSGEVFALSGSLDMSLQQTVELVSQTRDAERRLCLATTWDTSAVIVWGIPQIREGLDNALKVLVDKFCSDYLAVNTSHE